MYNVDNAYNSYVLRAFNKLMYVSVPMQTWESVHVSEPLKEKYTNEIMLKYTFLLSQWLFYLL